MARRNHEEERADRLAQLRQAFGEFEEMSEVEKSIARSYWDTTDTKAAPPDPWSTVQRSSQPTIQEEASVPLQTPSSALKLAVGSTATASELTSSLPVHTAEDIIGKVASFVSNVAELVDNHRLSARPAVTPPPKQVTEEVNEAIDHVRELEDFSADLETQLTPVEDEEESLIDEKLQEIVPTDLFTESPRQTALTMEEGKVIEAFLHPAETLATLTSDEDEIEVGPPSPTAQLDDIISRSPEVMNTYAQALSLPTTNDHNDCKELLVKMGVPVMEAIAPYEAEGLASSLAKAGLVDFVGTEDSDVLAYEVCFFEKLTVCGSDPS